MQPKISFDVDMQSVRWTESDLRAVKKAIRQSLAVPNPKLLRSFDLSAMGRLNLFASLTLTTDKKIQKINHEWRGKNKPTNVLSFPSGELENVKNWPKKIPLPLGDIILAYEACMRESRNFGIAFQDYIMFLAVHGALHLLGHDHETDGDHQKMITAELRILKQLKLANPYPLMQNAGSNA